MAPTREQLIANVKAMESQGAPPADIQSYLDSFKGQSPAPVAPVSRGTQPPQEDGFFKTLVKEPIKTLLVKPAARTAEALGRMGVFGNTIKQGYESMADEGQDINLNIPGTNLGLGKYHVDPVKTGMAGVKQIAGEGLETASYLVGGTGAAAAGKSVLKNTLGTAAKTGAKAGAISGATYGAGDALQQDKDLAGVVGQAAMGGVVGGVAGAAVPLAAAGVSKVVKGAVKTPGAVVGKISEKVQALDQPEPVRKAIGSGIDENVVKFVREAAPEDKVAFKGMYEMAEKAGKDLRFREQPRQIAGKTILDRANHLIKVKDLGVGQTQRVINSLGNKSRDVSDVTLQFLKDLQEKGVTVVKRGGGVQMISNGKVPNADLPFYRDIYRLLQPDKQGRVLKSYRNLHQLRQRIFNELNLAKARQQPFSDDVTSYGERLRALLADPIDTASKGKYRVAQRKTADALSSLRDFVQLIGYKGDLERIGAKDLRVSEVASRVLGNASDRPTAVLQGLDDMAKKYGYKAKGNYLDQIQFADLLDDVFGTRQTRSLRGQVGRGTLDAVSEATGAASDAAQGNLLGLAGRGVKAILGRSKDAQIRALKELLEFESLSAKPSSVFGRKR